MKGQEQVLVLLGRYLQHVSFTRDLNDHKVPEALENLGKIHHLGYRKK